MNYLLDANVCISIINAKPAHVLDRFRHQAIGDIGIPAVTAAELTFGVIKSGSQRNRLALEKFFAPLECAAFDAGACWPYGELRADLERRGHPIGALDTLIAAHALALGSTLLTNNASDFARVAGLPLENWV